MTIKIGKRQAKENTPVIHIGINPSKNIAPSRMRMESGHLYTSVLSTDHTIKPHTVQQHQIVNQQPKISDKQHQPAIRTSTAEKIDKIVFVSTWNMGCGIAMYTQYLMDELNKIIPYYFTVNSINGGVVEHNITGKLNHLQHEFGIMPDPPKVEGKVIMTWHTVPQWIDDIINSFKSKLDIVAHIVHCEGASNYIRSSKDVHVVKIGSTIMPNIKKEAAREFLNIKNINIPIGFVFGFQSPNKNYLELIKAARNTNIHLIISGSRHCSGYISRLPNDNNVTFLDKHLSEEEINLYSIASDILLFDYIEQGHYSSSSALHRTIGSGRPVICSDIKHFSDIENIPKFRSQPELENCIKYALNNYESLSKISLQFANETSWNNAAKRHIEIYKKYVDIQ